MRVSLALLILIAVHLSNYGYSQDKFIVNIDIGYPFPDNRLFTSHDGIVAINAGLSYKTLKNLYTAVSFNYISSKKDYPETFTRYYIPTINTKYRQKITNNFIIIPEIGIGITILDLRCSEYEYKENQFGLDVNGKLSIGYSFNNRYDLMAYYRYDYIYLKYDEEFTVLNYYRNLHISNLGLSFSIIL